MVISDFEVSLHSALQDELPNSSYRECHFNFAPAVLALFCVFKTETETEVISSKTETATTAGKVIPI